MMAAPLDENVQSISLHKSLPIVAHGYILPFIFLYATWLYGWVAVYGVDDYWEPGLIVLAVIGVVQILVSLSCYWSVEIRATLATLKVGRCAVYSWVMRPPNPIFTGYNTCEF